jgi:hypothetical protein
LSAAKNRQPLLDRITHVYVLLVRNRW